MCLYMKHVKLVVMSANFKPKRTAAASRGFLAIAYGFLVIINPVYPVISLCQLNSWAT